MDYQLENLGPERFQEFCQALLTRVFPQLQCFPVAQRDGGRDAIAYYREDSNDEFLVFQVKFVRKPMAEQDPHGWLVGVMEDEADKVKALIPKGAKAYYLLTNVPGTAYPDSGSIDKAHSLIQKITKIPSQCWWRGDIQARLDNAWDLKWAYPEIMSGPDMLRVLIEAGLSDEKERRTNALRAFIRDQYNAEVTVRFKQIELQNKLLDLFIDVPVFHREPQQSRDRKRRTVGYAVISQIAQRHPMQSAGTYDYVPADADLAQIRRGRREEGMLGAATMLLHDDVQKWVPYVVLEGAPGQGKSTITQYVCQVHRMRVLGEDEALADIDPQHRTGALRLPIRVDLRDLATWFGRQNPFYAAESNETPAHWHKSLESFLAALIRHHAGGIEFTINDLHAVGKTSAILLVLDGLDEVADIQRRKDVVDEVVRGVNRLAEIACSLQVVVTSRPAAFANSPGMPGDLFEYCELGSLTRPLINSYATRWLKARKLQGKEAADVNRILKSKMDQPHLRDLARNPMQLAILLSLIHTRGASLPDKRTALYDNYVELFFSREAEKSDVVRQRRDLLIDIHRYLAWVLHSESEQGRSRGSLKVDEMRGHVSAYLRREGHDETLAEQLFAGMIERVVALVSRVEGTYEFEVQPLREYFAARFLYETANYSPAGRECSGTLPDRFDAMAKNFFWLNVTRFYAGCFSKGELPSLVDRLEELVRTPGYKMISHPRVLAATLLSDWVFAQQPRSMRKVVTLTLDSLGLRRFVATVGQQRAGAFPLVLPKQCGNDELVEQCFALLKANPPKDFALALIELLDANTTIAERREPWRREIATLSGDELTQWIENGFHMQLLADLPDGEFDTLLSPDDPNRDRLGVAFRLPHLARWEKDERRFLGFMDAILDGDITAASQSRAPKHLLQAFAHCQSGWRFGVALRSRQPMSLSQTWKDSYRSSLTPLAGDEVVQVPDHESARRCAEYVQVVLECAKAPLDEWATSLDKWDLMIEKSRELFGVRWVQYRLACLAAGIKSVSEQCNDTPEMLDASKSLSRRARYARLRAGQPGWWERQLLAAKSELDSCFVLLVLLTWGSKNCLTSLAAPIAVALEGLSTPVWIKVWTAVRQSLEVIRNDGSEDYLELDLDSVPPPPCERLLAAFGERASPNSAARLYFKYLASYSGSDYAVLHFGQRQAIGLLFGSSGDKDSHLSMIERSYARGVMVDYAFSRWRHTDPQRRPLSATVAERIASQPDRFPMDLVGVAEEVCKESVSSQVVPVGIAAEKEHWFQD